MLRKIKCGERLVIFIVRAVSMENVMKADNLGLKMEVGSDSGKRCII